MRQCNQDSIAVSFVTTNKEDSNINLNQLEPSVMYTQIFEEILLEIEHDERSITNFTQMWRQQYTNYPITLKIIDEFEREY